MIEFLAEQLPGEAFEICIAWVLIPVAGDTFRIPTFLLVWLRAIKTANSTTS